MTHPKVAIVTPLYNTGEHLDELARSIRSQSMQEWQWILIDDGSTDDSFARAKKWVAKDSRIRAISQENQGPSAARNRGVLLSRVPVIFFVDADDLILPEALAAQYIRFSYDRYLGASFGRVRILDRTRPEWRRATKSRHLIKSGDCLLSNPAGTMSGLAVRRAAFDAIGPLREDMRHAEDQEWLLRAAHHDLWKLSGCSAFFVTYFVNAGSLSSNNEAMEAGWREVLRTAQRLDPLLVEQTLPRALAANQINLARRALRDKGNFKAGLVHLSKALRYRFRSDDLAVLVSENFSMPEKPGTKEIELTEEEAA